MKSVSEYVKNFIKGTKVKDTTGLLGRVIRGKNFDDFRTLSDDPDRIL